MAFLTLDAFCFCGRRNSASRRQLSAFRGGDGNKQIITSRVNTRAAEAGLAISDDSCFDAFSSREPVPTSLENAMKRKGPQLALEPLNGQGIAGYVPEPELWTRPLLKIAPPGEAYML
jgi:hypothetical protein